MQQAIDLEALARLLDHVGVTPERLERSVREAREAPLAVSGHDYASDPEVQTLTELLRANVEYFEHQRHEQDVVLNSIRISFSTFRSEAAACQRIFARSVIRVSFLIGLAMLLLLAVLGLDTFLAWPELTVRFGSAVPECHDGSFPSSRSAAVVG